MAPASVAILLCVALSTVWLFIYTRRTLPRRLDERIAESVKAFGTAIELRFPSHQGLMLRVIGLSRAVAQQMGLSSARLRNLETAGRLRDIGLCCVPYRLVNGLDFAEWNAADRSAYFQHAESGAAMLRSVPELKRLAKIVRYHHARFDGADEPSWPCGTSLPIESRILKVVVDYVWLERRSGSLLARDAIRAGIGSTYCPDAARLLLSVLSSTGTPRREPALI